MTKISVKQAAEMLRIDIRAVRELVRSGEFGKAIEGGDRITYLIYREQVEKWLGGAKWSA